MVYVVCKASFSYLLFWSKTGGRSETCPGCTSMLPGEAQWEFSQDLRLGSDEIESHYINIPRDPGSPSENGNGT